MSFALLILGSCSKSKDDPQPVSPFAGTYTEDDYDFKIESAGGNNFKIQNFGGFLNKPLNAQVTGATLTIPTQTFTNPNGHVLTITGTAVLAKNEQNENIIRIQYSITGFTDYEGEIIGIRK